MNGTTPAGAIPAKVSVLPTDRPAVPGNPLRRNPDGADGLPYIQPGPWKSKLTEKDVVGVWLGFGVGAPKQYFIIKKVGNRLRGMVCGTCDNPYTMAALDDFRIDGDTLTYLVQYSRVIAPAESDRSDGDLHAVAFRRGQFTCAAVGPKATSSSWVRSLNASIR